VAFSEGHRFFWLLLGAQWWEQGKLGLPRDRIGSNGCRLEGPKALPTVGATNGYGKSLFRRARRPDPGRRGLASSQAGGESALDQRVLSLPRSELGTAKQMRGTALGKMLVMARLLKKFWEVGP